MAIEMEESLNKYLESIYYNPKHPASFSSLNELYRAVKKDGRKATLKVLRDWLASQHTYTSHRKVVKKFKRPRVIVSHKHEIYGTDTAHLNSYKKSNDGYGYFVVMIDLLSRYAMTHPLKSLTGVEMVSAMKVMFKKSKCETIWSDHGTEYYCKPVQTYLKAQNIHHYTTGHETKCAVAERVLKSIKNRLFRYMTKNQTHSWVNVLESITDAYNHAYNRSIKLSPSEALKMDDPVLWRRQYINSQEGGVVRAFKHQIGDRVKLSYLSDKFSREYDMRWSGEVFTVTTRVFNQGIPMYNVKSYDGEPVIGKFYEEELQKTVIDGNTTYHVEKVLKTRKRDGKAQCLVKWSHWPSKYNTWILKSTLKSFK